MTTSLKFRNIALVVFLPAVFALIFAKFFDTSTVLMTTDAAISSANQSAANVFHQMPPHWDDGSLLGGPQGAGTQIVGFILALLPGILWNNLVYGLACLAGSLMFLRGFGKQVNGWAALCGGLAAFWLGNNFTMIYPGHDHKPYVIFFFVCALLSTGIESWRGGIIWGSFIGLMFVQQPDIALFFALIAGAHLVFRLWRREGFKPARWLPVLIPAAVVALLFASGPLLSGYKLNVQDTAQVQTEKTSDKWDYITQWSWPPEESIAFIAPGYTGWRTGEPEGPYYGRMGRSPGWEQTHQGYMNFQLDSLYIGFIPFAFALFAIFAARRSPHRADIIFWGSAMLIALLLAFGKYFPLYSLFYQLPVVSNIRAPVKFIQVFQVALAILAAYGIDMLLFKKHPESSLKSKKVVHTDSAIRWFFWGVAGTAGLLLLWALSLSLSPIDSASAFSKLGWPDKIAQVIVANQTRAIWHAFIMASFTAVAFAIYSFERFLPLQTKGYWIGAALALVIATDALLLSKHYVQTMPSSYIQSNDLTHFLQDNLGTQRVALLTQQDLYNIWLTYLLPYNHIPTFNFSQMARMPIDYKNFLAAGSKDPFRMWRFSGVKYLLGPSAFEKQLPAGTIKKVFSYDLTGTRDNEFQLIPTPKGTHAVFELLNSIPRYVLIAGFEPIADAQTLARIADSRQPLLGGQCITGTVEIVNARAGRVMLKTFATVPTMLRVTVRWDPDWKARVDGKETEVKRIDYICQGVEIPPGAHTVSLIYSPAKGFFYMQIAGFLVLLTTSISLFFRNRSPADIGIKNGAAAV
ncbi:MAG: hypothetical protein WCO42_11260 [bacterium]